MIACHAKKMVYVFNFKPMGVVMKKAELAFINTSPIDF